MKPSSPLKVGDLIHVSKTGIVRDIEVTHLIVKRVSAEMAAKCYIDHTPQERIDAYREARAAANAHRPSGAGRPTKRDRRDIDSLKNALGDLGYGNE